MTEQTSSPTNLVYQLAGLPLAGEASGILAARASGLEFSPDAGRTWQPALDSLQLSEPVPVVTLGVSPDFEKDRTIFAGLPGGMLRSTDGGQNWRVLSFPAPPPTITCLVLSPRFLEDGRVIAGTAEDGILISTNAGDEWRPWNFGLIEPEVLCLAISAGFERDETLFAGTASGLFRSTNAGRSWRELALPPGFVPVLSLALSANFEDDRSLYGGTEENGLFHSRDGGESWQPVEEDLTQNPLNALIAGKPGLAPGWLLALWGGELVLSRDGNTWETLRLPTGDGQATAVLAPDGLAPGFPLLVGLVDGQVVRLDLPG